MDFNSLYKKLILQMKLIKNFNKIFNNVILMNYKISIELNKYKI